MSRECETCGNHTLECICSTRKRFSNLNEKPFLFGGIDPPAEAIIDYSIPDEIVEYPSCRKCGASHGMGIKDLKTGKIDPLDLCNYCFWSNNA